MPTNKCRFLPLLVAICPAEVTFSERLRPHVHAQSTSRREKKRKKTNKLLTSTEPLLFWGGAWLDSRRFRYQELPLDGAGLHFSEAVLWHVGVDVDLVAVLSRPRILDVALDLVVADRASVPGIVPEAPTGVGAPCQTYRPARYRQCLVAHFATSGRDIP
eukprot:337454-Rhodomonas_salina.3